MHALSPTRPEYIFWSLCNTDNLQTDKHHVITLHCNCIETLTLKTDTFKVISTNLETIMILKSHQEVNNTF